MKPPVDSAVLAHLDLRVGTVTAVRRLPELADLAVLEVRCQRQLAVLVPVSLLRELDIGTKVVAAVGLHPMTVGNAVYSAAFLCGPVDAQLPDDSRLS